MNPITMASGATPIIVQHGVLGVLVLASCSVIMLLSTATIVLWRARESEIKKRVESDKEHYQWALQEVARKTELESRMADTLSSVVSAVQATKDIVTMKGSSR